MITNQDLVLNIIILKPQSFVKCDQNWSYHKLPIKSFITGPTVVCTKYTNLFRITEY